MKTNVNIELSIDDFWLVREAIDKRIAGLREHIAYMNECLGELDQGGAIPLIGGGERGRRHVKDFIENFEGQIRKHQWLLDIPFSADFPTQYEDDEE